MNREIKFRGKRLDNGMWIYGDLMQHQDGDVYVGDNTRYWTDDGYHNNNYEEVRAVDDETVGQYTGLKDAKGREIYEDDILGCPEDCDCDGEVEWEYVDTHGYTHLDYHKCPVCNGTGNEREAIMKPTGRMILHKEAVIGIYEQKFNAEHIVALRDAMELLGVDKVRYTASHSMGGNTFILSDGITVIISPNVAYTPGVWVNRKKK